MMSTEEKFKTWLTTIYVSDKTGSHLNTPIHYAGGIKALNRLLNLPGEGIFDESTDLQQIRERIDNMPNRNKDYSSHFNAFCKFRDYETERRNISLQPSLRQTDAFKKQMVERAAVDTVIRYYEDLEYTVFSREKDNIGWDLEARKGSDVLLLEVKGLSGNGTCVELTPNEYENLKAESKRYKLCIVTAALTNPTLEIFSFNESSNCWLNAQNEQLTIEERMSAKFWKS